MPFRLLQSAFVLLAALAAPTPDSPPPPKPGGPVEGCVSPPVLPLETPPKDAATTRFLASAVGGEALTREAGEKLHREVVEEIEQHRKGPDAIDRFKVCSQRLTDVFTANPKRPSDACLGVIAVCDGSSFGPGCCASACLEAVHADCKLHGCASGQQQIEMFERAILKGTCVPGWPPR